MTKVTDSTHIRVLKLTNERMKPYADALGTSVSDFAERGLAALMDILDGTKEPLLVAEYRLKKQYQEPPAKKPKSR